ncbi:hypothetical protein KJ980_03825 [Patescibacteria group bacterium]|nr:hypothetical protein [Patescibacteria group bacterium]
MSDSNQIQNPTTPVQVSALPQGISSPHQQAGRIVEPPAISGHREHGPVSAVKSEFTKPVETQPEITPSTPHEIMIPQELKNTIEKASDAHDPKIEKNTPLKLAKESTPVITTPTGIIRLPMTYKQAVQKEKNSSFRDSIHWFAAMIMYQWRKYDPGNIKK